MTDFDSGHDERVGSDPSLVFDYDRLGQEWEVYLPVVVCASTQERPVANRCMPPDGDSR